MKILIIYNYFKKDNFRKNNLKFFLRHGIYNYLEIDCIIINRSNDFDIDITEFSNVIVKNYENIGICINGYKYGLNISDIEKYNYFVLMNDSMIGPFIKETSVKWYEKFIKLLNEKTKIVGSYQQNNIPQSGFLFFDKDCAYEIRNFLNNHNIIRPQDALKLEAPLIFNLINKLKCNTDGTLKKKIRWTNKHDIFDVIFEKENRIGLNTSIFWSSSSNKDINYITRDALNNAIEFMNNKILTIF
jgi:hypothetical protein